MKIEIQLEPECTEPKIIVVTDKVTDDINALIKRLSAEQSLAGFLSYAGIFTAIFVAVWLTQYFSWKQKIKKMNAMVHKNKE